MMSHQQPYKDTIASLHMDHAFRELGGGETLWNVQEGLFLQQGNGQRLHHFSSNDYLNLSQHPRLKEVAIEAIHRYGTGINSSRLVAGEHLLHHALESKICEWKSSDASLCFSSGYQANITMLQALCDKNSIILMDKLNHASLVDGCRLSGAQWFRYQHLDMPDLERRLKKLREKHGQGVLIWVVSDSLFSMDGDTLDVSAWCDVAERYGAYTYLDEAHAAGIYGNTKRSGLAEAHGCEHRIDVQMGTFSKALGSTGAYVACSQTLRDLFINTGRGFIYTTSLPPSVLAVNQAAIEVVMDDPTPTQTLWNQVQQAQRFLADHPTLQALQRPTSTSHIIPITIGSNERALDLAEALKESGYFVKAIRPPTVPPNQARLRISLSAGHTSAQIAGLFETLENNIR